MTITNLIRLLGTFPPDARCVIELPDGETSAPIQGAVQYRNSANPQQVHLLTSTASAKKLPSITAKNHIGKTVTFTLGDDITHIFQGSHFPGTLIGFDGEKLLILWPDDAQSTVSPATCFHG